MPMKNIDATRSLTGVIDIALHRKIHEFFNDLVKNANTLYAANKYFAIQEAIIDAPEDLGVVRAAATYHHQRKYSVGYEYTIAISVKANVGVSTFRLPLLSGA